MSVYKVQFRLQIHGSFSAASSNDIYMIHETELSFPPYPGLTYQHGEIEAELFDDSYGRDAARGSCQIVWQDDEQKFVVYCGENKEIYQNQRDRKPHRPIEEIVKEYEELGWKKDLS